MCFDGYTIFLLKNCSELYRKTMAFYHVMVYGIHYVSRSVCATRQPTLNLKGIEILRTPA